MSEQSQALTVAGRTALQVDDNEAKEYAKQLLTHASAGNALFPKDMSQSQAVVLARLALAYGLDPIAGELIPYQGKAYVTIDGRIRKAQENAAYDGLECNPATDDERKAFRCGEDEHLWIARVWRKDRRVPFVGYGRAGGKGDRNPVSREYGAEMAQKRAKARALRDAFSMPLPSYEDEEPRTSRPSVSYSAPVIEHDARTIDTETGVILDGEYAEVEGPLTSQTRKIHTLVGKLGWDDDEYRALLREAFGVESSTDMTEGQAAALSETLAVLYAVAESDQSAVRVQDAVAAMKKRAAKLRAVEGDDDRSWQRTQEREAARKAALDAAGMDTVIESAAQQVTLTDAEYRETLASEPEGQMFEDVEQAAEEMAQKRETKAEKSARRAAMEMKITQYMSAGAALDMDLAPYEYDESTSDGALEAKGVKLAAAIRKLTGAPEPATTAAKTA